MATIQFGGLATGLDTKSIISQLMAVEQQPITLLQSNKTSLNDRLTAYTTLDTKLKSFADGIKDLNYSSKLVQRTITQSSNDDLTATISGNALTGTSYQVEVVATAQAQKSISASGVADKTSATFGTGTLNFTVNGESQSVDITSGNNSLEGIMNAINSADIGISAAIINDGSSAPYRLMLTGKNVGNSFSLDNSTLSGGTDFKITSTPIQPATKAHIKVDNYDIYSDSNTLTEAIPGVTLDLLKAEQGKTTTLKINIDKDAIKSSIKALATGYNDVVSFVTSQSVINGSEGGVLNGDASINSIKRHLQDLLTQPFANSGVFTSLSQLGFETQKDGTLQVNDTTLSSAVSNNLDSVVTVLTGENGKKGLATQFKDYLYAMTNSGTGMLKGKKDSINSNIKKIDSQVTTMQSRIDQRQKTMEAQFSAMENLVSGLNSQSTYLTQQMTLLSNMMTGSKS